MTTTLPPGHVVCPHCINYHGRDNITECQYCHDEGSIPDPRIAQWYSDDPAKLLELLGGTADANQKKLIEWGRACGELCNKRAGVQSRTGSFRFDDWLDPDFGTAYVKRHEAADIMRCLFPPHMERERVKCPECSKYANPQLIADEGWYDENDETLTEQFGCDTCQGSGTIPAPIFDPRWLSSNVLDLAKVIRGSYPCCEAVKRFEYADGRLLQGKCPIHGDTFPPNHDPFGYSLLADALMDAGVDNDEIIRHCRAETHIRGCWVIDAILGA